MTNKSAPTRAALTALAVLTVAGVLAACGSGSSSSGQTSSATAASRPRGNRTALATCLRKHGIKVPAGVAPGGVPGGPAAGAPGGGPGQLPPGGPPAGGFPGAGGNPKFRAALKACGANLPARPRLAFSRQRIQRYVTCVRQHGYKLPNPNFSGKGPVFPAGILSNQSFQKASRACQKRLARAQGGAPPGM